MSFALNVAEWVKGTKKETARLHKAIILELFSSVILDTPVLDGRLRGNWIISSDTPENGTIEIEDPSGSVTVGKANTFLATLDPERDFNVFLANNLPYAYRIEYDGWSHTKAPEGMVRKNLIRISNNLKAGR